MGHRANFVLVGADGWRLYHARSAANGIINYLAAGPDAATRFVEVQVEVQDREDDGWYNQVDAEGGAVVDLTRRRLLFYGNDQLSELPCKRAALALLTETWPGWQIDWAFDGQGDLVDYVGVHRDVVRVPDSPNSKMRPLEPPSHDDEATLITVRHDDGTITAHLVWSELWGHVAWHGPTLLDRLPPPLPRSHVCAHIPAQGLHVEVASGLVGYWTTSAVFDLTARTTGQWAGWRVELWGDRVEEQVARCGDAVRIPDLDLGTAHRRLTEALEREREYSLDWLNRTDAEECDDPWFMSYLVALGDDANWARVTAGLAAVRHRLVE